MLNEVQKFELQYINSNFNSVMRYSPFDL